MKKILITGPYSTGKSTTVSAVAEAMKKGGLAVVTVEEAARRCAFPLGLDQTVHATLWLFHQQLADEVAATISVPDVILCDRGVPDILGHWLDIRQGMTDGRLVETLLPYLKVWCGAYDHVFLSDIDETIPPEPDAIRNGDPLYRTRMQDRALEALALMGMDPPMLPRRLEDRIRFIAADLDVHGLVY